MKSSEQAAQNSASQNQPAVLNGVLGDIQFAELPTVQRGKATCAVRLKGLMVFSTQGSDVIRENGSVRFRIGKAKDDSGKLYLVPTADDDKNGIKPIKNGPALAIRNEKLFASLGVEYKNKYAVTAERDGDTKYVALTPVEPATEEELTSGDIKEAAPEAGSETPSAE